MRAMIIVVLLVFLSCKNDTTKTDIVESKTVQEEEKEQLATDINMDLDVYDYDGLEPLINKTDDKVHVVNFWATWCAPCVKELPYFERINKNYKSKGVEVLLVSLDFPKNYDSKLKPFIKKYHLKSQVVALDDTDQNRWIPAIDKEWSGAIPATIIYNGKKRLFYERSFTQEELEKELKQFLK
jgi:thiol-disulfide isomerase/thioredoxin